MIGEDLADTMTRVRAGEVRSVADAPPGVPPALVRFFDDAFSSDRRRRPTSAAALRAALAQVQEDVVSAI
jgi:hypothetical protein